MRSSIPDKRGKFIALIIRDNLCVWNEAYKFLRKFLLIGLNRNIKETLINWRYERITSLRGTRSLAYRVDMSRLLHSVRLVLHLVC